MKNIFVIGDSRTGTTSLHRLFLDFGYKSIHYFMDEVAEIASKDDCARHEYRHFREFIENSGYDAFSDYPTRIYFRQLHRDYPGAYFILSTRRDLATWEKSMRKYFPGRPDVLGKLEHLSKIHIQINNQIRDLFSNAQNFIEICIDDGNGVNSRIIADFIGAEKVVPMTKLNAR